VYFQEVRSNKRISEKGGIETDAQNARKYIQFFKNPLKAT